MTDLDKTLPSKFQLICILRPDDWLFAILKCNYVRESMCAFYIILFHILEWVPEVFNFDTFPEIIVIIGQMFGS